MKRSKAANARLGNADRQQDKSWLAIRMTVSETLPYARGSGQKRLRVACGSWYLTPFPTLKHFQSSFERVEALLERLDSQGHATDQLPQLVVAH